MDSVSVEILYFFLHLPSSSHLSLSYDYSYPDDLSTISMSIISDFAMTESFFFLIVSFFHWAPWKIGS